MILAVAAASIFLLFGFLNEEDWFDSEIGVFADECGFGVVGFETVVGTFDVAIAWMGKGDGRRKNDEGIHGSAGSWERGELGINGVRGGGVFGVVGVGIVYAICGADGDDHDVGGIFHSAQNEADG